MKIAYMVLAHKNSEQISMLIDQLKDEDTDLFIHIDKKNEVLYEELNELYPKESNIKILSNRISVNWSGFSQVYATLNLLNAVIDSGVKYDYVSLLSGQCFPIKSNSFIKKFLEENKGLEFIEYIDITKNKKYSYRLKTYNFFRENKNIRRFYMRALDGVLRRIQKLFINRNNFKDMNLYQGSQWVTITYDCVEYIIEYIESNPQILKDFKHTLVPDEHFFQMLILNSKYKTKVVNHNLRFIDWKNMKNSPKVLNCNDIDRLKYSADLFGRKLDMDLDKEVLYKLKKQITR